MSSLRSRSVSQTDATRTTGYVYASWQSKKYCYTSIPEVNARLERTVQSRARGDRVKYEKVRWGKGATLEQA
ncbi:hypothetical protein [uncultured Nostoc sp.]|uniref:hypothetical protein n=1 Tax=uncultured Nostoc sp. TaxID=340711 RepID=UPI0035CC3C5C